MWWFRSKCDNVYRKNLFRLGCLIIKNLLRALTLGFAFSSFFIILPTIQQAQARPYFATTTQATAKAKQLGYKKINECSNGQPVYQATKSAVVRGLSYITPDVDSHNGGAWKLVLMKKT
ncbi:hypothetical protein C0206_08135 [Moraxella catarrhalis]|nr:hypothetical protein [Moraxella catarrhalis]MPW95064.1 hypothetical protein [Moraxella catarrhalis]MPX00622.1 hypothetical protein [Moraxella catarrhalis]MPX11002.1 hypothetical protein [Moraxella catarrhalis]MPX13342.1 hypothetical protein [Moraxella catarrhalis]